MYSGMNKRGFELGWIFLFTSILCIMIIIIMTLWIVSQGSGELMKKQILAKQVCVMITEARPETTIMIEHDKKTSIERKDSGIVVKQGSFDIGYYYDCYIEDNVNFMQKDNVTIIEIK